MRILSASLAITAASLILAACGASDSISAGESGVGSDSAAEIVDPLPPTVGADPLPPDLVANPAPSDSGNADNSAGTGGTDDADNGQPNTGGIVALAFDNGYVIERISLDAPGTVYDQMESSFTLERALNRIVQTYVLPGVASGESFISLDPDTHRLLAWEPQNLIGAIASDLIFPELTVGYDANGQVESMTSTNAVKTYRYDDAGELVEQTLVETSTLGYRVALSREPGTNALMGELLRLTSPTDPVPTPYGRVEYDEENGRITEIRYFTTSAPTAPFRVVKIRWDAEGNPNRIEEERSGRVTGTLTLEYVPSSPDYSMPNLGRVLLKLNADL